MRQLDAPTGPTRDHATYIGGSDIAALVGVSPYATALDLWAVKTGRVPAFEGNESTEVGIVLERPVLALYAKRCGIARMDYPGTITHPTLDHIAATPDVVADARIAQCKIVGVRQASRWGQPKEAAEGVPPEVLCQVNYEAALARRVLDVASPTADVVALVGTDLRVFEVEIDVPFGDDLIEIADDFWCRHVVGNVLPEVIESRSAEVLRRVFPRVLDPRIKVADAEVYSLALAYDTARAQEGVGKKSKEAIGARLCSRIGDGFGFASVADGIKVTWGEKEGSVSWKEVAARYRDVAIRLGAKGASLNVIEAECRGEPTRAIDVRVKRRR